MARYSQGVLRPMGIAISKRLAGWVLAWTVGHPAVVNGFSVVDNISKIESTVPEPGIALDTVYGRITIISKGHTVTRT